MIETNTLLEDAAKKFGNEILSFIITREKRATLNINPGLIMVITSFLLDEKHFRFIIASAVHTRKGFEIYYHFSYDPTGLIMNVHVILPMENPVIESLANKIEAANWIEREMHELFGIIFLNHPQPEALISDGNWAEGVYPYRKDAKELKME